MANAYLLPDDFPPGEPDLDPEDLDEPVDELWNELLLVPDDALNDLAEEECACGLLIVLDDELNDLAEEECATGLLIVLDDLENVPIFERTFLLLLRDELTLL